MTAEESFEIFYRDMKDACLRAVIATGADRYAAEEAVAEAFARAWASWAKVRKHPAPVAWVVRTALNHRVSRWRRTRREVAWEVDVGDLSNPTARSEHDDLLRAVSALPDRQREVVALRILLDLDTAQTAAVLGIAAGTVTAHLHRAMTTLRATIPIPVESQR